MANWRTYKITNRRVDSGYIVFELDGYVTFENGETRKRIDCKNTCPWNNIYQGDYLEVNLDETRRRGPGYDFTSTSEVRKGSMSLIHGSSSTSTSLIGGRSHLNERNLRREIERVNNGAEGFSTETRHKDSSGEYYEYIEYNENYAHYERTRRW